MTNLIEALIHAHPAIAAVALFAAIWLVVVLGCAVRLARDPYLPDQEVPTTRKEHIAGLDKRMSVAVDGPGVYELTLTNTPDGMALSARNLAAAYGRKL